MIYIILHSLGLTLGLVLAWFAAKRVWEVRQLFSQGKEYTAEITGFVTEKNEEGNIKRMNIICRFTDEQNQPHELKDNANVRSLSYAKGDKVKVLFIVGQPEKTILADRWSLYKKAVYLVAAAWCFFVIDGCYFLTKWWL